MNKKLLFSVNCMYNENKNYFKNDKLIETVGSRGKAPVGGLGDFFPRS